MALFNKDKLRRLQAKTKEDKKLTIMIVDDEKMMLKVLTEIFSDRYDVITAEDGQEALETIEAMSQPGTIRAIISDHQMPRLTGLNLFMRSMSMIPDSVRIIITGYLEDIYNSDIIEKAKIHKVITKPFDANNLRHIVDRALLEFDGIGRKEQHGTI